MDKNRETKQNLSDYENLIAYIRELRKNSISMAELCRKLDAQRTTIYRIESGEVDPRLSTLINYLHGFGYHLEIVSDRKRPQEVDIVVNVESDDSHAISNIDIKGLSKRERVDLLRSLLECYESELDSDS